MKQLAFVLSGAAACTSFAVQWSTLPGAAPRAPRNPAEVQVFQGKPNRAHTVVASAYYDWKADGVMTTAPMALNVLKERAAEFGADCLMEVKEETGLGPANEGTVSAKVCVFGGGGLSGGGREPSDAGADDLTPRGGSAKRPRAVALVIGVETYRRDLPAATGAESDARLFAEHVQKVLGVPAANVRLLLGSDATKSSIDAQLDEWLPRNASPSDDVFFFFAGHGAPDPISRARYLVPWDAEPQFITSQGVEVANLTQRLARLSAAREFVFLDSCFSGLGGRSVLAPGARPLVLLRTLAAAPRLSILSASGADEISGAYGGHGLFSYFLMRGMDGDADANSDGAVTYGELAAYVSAKVPEEARRQNREQHPQMIGDGARNVVLTRRGMR